MGRREDLLERARQSARRRLESRLALLVLSDTLDVVCDTDLPLTTVEQLLAYYVRSVDECARGRTLPERSVQLGAQLALHLSAASEFGHSLRCSPPSGIVPEPGTSRRLGMWCHERGARRAAHRLNRICLVFEALIAWIEERG